MPPKATIQSITRTRLAYRPGMDQVTVTFTFDEPVVDWTVRINSTSHLDGNEAEALSGLGGLGFGQMPFGGPPFGGIKPGVVLTGTALIEADMLLHGANQVVVYGKGLDGRWTLPPVGAPSVPA